MTEYSSNFRRALLLHHEETEENHQRDGNDNRLESRRDDLQAFHGAEHRDSRRDDTVAVKKCGTDEAEHDDDLLSNLVLRSLLLLKNQREQREHSAFASVICAQDEDQVFDTDDEDERPDNEGEHSVNIFRNCSQPVLRLEAFSEGIEWTRPDVPVDDSEGNDS